MFDFIRYGDKWQFHLLRPFAWGTKGFPIRGAAIRLLNWLYPADRRQQDYRVEIISEYQSGYIVTSIRNFLEYEIFFFGDHEPLVRQEAAEVFHMIGRRP